MKRRVTDEKIDKRSAQLLHKMGKAGIRLRFDFGSCAIQAESNIIYYRVYWRGGRPSCLMIGLPAGEEGICYD